MAKLANPFRDYNLNCFEYLKCSFNIVNDRGFDGDEYYHQFQLAEKGNPDRIIEGIELVFIELKKFRPQSLSDTV